MFYCNLTALTINVNLRSFSANVSQLNSYMRKFFLLFFSCDLGCEYNIIIIYIRRIRSEDGCPQRVQGDATHDGRGVPSKLA